MVSGERFKGSQGIFSRFHSVSGVSRDLIDALRGLRVVLGSPREFQISGAFDRDSMESQERFMGS